MTNGGLQFISSLLHLQHLSLKSCRVNDSGVEHIIGLRLERLDLSWCSVSDHGFAHVSSYSAGAVLPMLDLKASPRSLSLQSYDWKRAQT